METVPVDKDPPLEVLGFKFAIAQQQLTETEILYKQIGRRITSLEYQAKKIHAQLYKSHTPQEDKEKIEFLKKTVSELEVKHKRAEKCKERLQNFVERLAVIQVMYAAKSQNQIVEEIIEEEPVDVNEIPTNDNNVNQILTTDSFDNIQTRARRQTRVLRSNVVFEINKLTAKFKVCILGPQCGKSAFLYRFVTGEWTLEDSPTVEHSYYKKFCPNSFEEYQLEILDTSGDDTYTSLRAGWYQSNCDGFILFLNTTSKSSYEEIKIFHKQLLQALGKTQVPKIIVATAIDAGKSRVVSRSQLIDLSAGFGCPFIEVSAKTGAYVEESFQLIIQQMQQFELVKGISQNLRKLEPAEHSPVIPPHLANHIKQSYRGSNFVGRHLVSEFQNVGTLLSHRYDGELFSVFDVETPLRCWRAQPKEQVAVTVTKSDELRFIHLATRTCRTQIDVDSESQEKPSVLGILFANLPKTDFKTGELKTKPCVVFVTSNKLLVHELPTNPWKLEFNHQPIREIHLNDGDKSYNLPTQFNPEFSNFIDYSRFVLVGAFGFQVWWHDIHASTVNNGTQICNPCKLMLKYDSEQHGIQESFLGINVCATAIVARTSSRCLLWELPTLQTEITGPVTLSPPKKNILFTSLIVDSLSVFTGDNKGGISLWNFGGKLVRVLNEARKRSITTADEDDSPSDRTKSYRSLFGHNSFRPPPKDGGSTSALGMDLTNRVTDMVKISKILFAASADSHIYVHDVSKSKQAPLEVISLNHFIPKSLHVLLEEGMVLCKAQKKAEKGSGQNLTPVTIFRWKLTETK